MVEIAIAKSKNCKSGLIQVGSEASQSAIHKLINSIWNNKELADQWKESIIVPVYK
jgi:hypothetical protein